MRVSQSVQKNMNGDNEYSAGEKPTGAAAAQQDIILKSTDQELVFNKGKDDEEDDEDMSAALDKATVKIGNKRGADPLDRQGEGQDEAMPAEVAAPKRGIFSDKKKSTT